MQLTCELVKLSTRTTAFVHSHCQPMSALQDSSMAGGTTELHRHSTARSSRPNHKHMYADSKNHNHPQSQHTKSQQRSSAGCRSERMQRGSLEPSASSRYLQVQLYLWDACVQRQPGLIRATPATSHACRLTDVLRCCVQHHGNAQAFTCMCTSSSCCHLPAAPSVTV